MAKQSFTFALKCQTPFPGITGRRTTHLRKKVPSLIWRGTTTGHGLRADYVRELSRAGFNVKFNRVVQNREKWITSPEMMGESIPFETIQKHRYLLSLEGMMSQRIYHLSWQAIQSSSCHPQRSKRGFDMVFCGHGSTMFRLNHPMQVYSKNASPGWIITSIWRWVS